MPIRVVLDTNVVFEGLTKRSGACGLIIDAWQAGIITVCLSTSLILEYEDVFSRKLAAHRWPVVRRILKGLFAQHTKFVDIAFTWRPVSPDSGDDHVIDCTMNASAILVTSNVRDFAEARRKIGLQVLTPSEFLAALLNSPSIGTPTNGHS